MSTHRRRGRRRREPDGPALWIDERRFPYDPFFTLPPVVHGVAEDGANDARERSPDRPRWILDGFRDAVRRLRTGFGLGASRRR